MATSSASCKASLREAFVERNAERRELTPEITHTDAKCEPTAGKDVERCGSFRKDEGVPIRQRDEVGQQADRRVSERHCRQRDERIEGVVATCRKPAARRSRMIGDENVIEPTVCRSPGDCCDCVSRLDPLRHRVCPDRDPEAESHVSDARERDDQAVRRCQRRHGA